MYNFVDETSDTPDARAIRSSLALKRRVSRNVNRALALDDAMFAWKPRHAILILTLTYRERWMPYMSLDDLRRDRDTFLNNTPFNSLLQGIGAYNWKCEEGFHGGGLHLHLVVYYDAERITAQLDDVFYAQAIADYWVNNVTHGRGQAWNSNANKAQNARGPFGDVTGIIDRDNAAKRQALRDYLARYLCKSEQQVAARSLHDRMFGSSQFPD